MSSAVGFTCNDCYKQTMLADVSPLPTECPKCGGIDLSPIMPVVDLVEKGMPQMAGAVLKPTKGLKGIKGTGKTATASTLGAQIAKAKAITPGAPPVTPPVTPPPLPQVPKTQKAKGIKVLQDAGMLDKGFAQVALTELQAVTAAQSIGLPCFVRPCPITPRHGFVDSRVVKTVEEVRGVWGKAREADPQAEMIVMPYVDATHNMVWRPGLLGVGPGHDGATGGHDSISIFLEADYSAAWKSLATKAGTNLDTQDPFIEAVCNGAHEMVVAQIRAGDKGAPTEPDWNPHTGMIVANVVTIDPAHKSDPGAMLEWETTAKTLKPGHDVVWNPGGNLGDHWSVHARLAQVSVATTFKPIVGQTLPKMGIDLAPLEPQAIIFGFLGGVLSPSLGLPVMRKRAVCAALLGSHHGMMMGGDAGVHIGASVAMMLRLAQAAIWGESRHTGSKAHPKAGQTAPKWPTGVPKGSRDQIYTSILDRWLVGRQGLEDRAKVYLTHSWGGGFGGQAWAACSQATCDLDAAMLELCRVPSRMNARKVLATLTNVVNMAHNNGWWLNKFCTSDWFDLAASLDPRVAIMAGPIWYDATLAPASDRMLMLAQIEKLKPIDLTQYGSVTMPKVAKTKANPETATLGHVTPTYTPPKPSLKLGGFGMVGFADTLAISGGGFVPTKAQIKLASGDTLHVQIGNDQGQYFSGQITTPGEWTPALIAQLAEGPKVTSMGGTGADYYQVMIGPVSGGGKSQGLFTLAGTMLAVLA